MMDAVGNISVDGKNMGHICVSPAAHNVQRDFRWILDSPLICNAEDLLHFQEAERARERSPTRSVGYLAVI